MHKYFLKIILLLFFISFIFSQDKLPTAFLKDLDGKKIDILDLHNNGPMAISFWFLACEPCKKEMKYLDQFNNKYSENGFKVVSVNTDNSRTINRVKPYINSKKYSFTVLNDPKSIFFRKLGGKICPYLILVDKDGNIVSKHTGYNPGDEIKLEKEIKELLVDAKIDSTILDSTIKLENEKPIILPDLIETNEPLDEDQKE